MKHGRILAVGLLIVFPAGAAGAEATATVNVTITVLPYAQVTLDQTSVEMAVPAGDTSYGPVYVGGTIFCNTSTTLFTTITKPTGAPGDWFSYPVSEIKEPGQGYDPHLLRIMIWNIPDYLGAWTVTLNVSGETVQDPGEVELPPAGEVRITVVPG